MKTLICKIVAILLICFACVYSINTYHTNFVLIIPLWIAMFVVGVA